MAIKIRMISIVVLLAWLMLGCGGGGTGGVSPEFTGQAPRTAGEAYNSIGNSPLTVSAAQGLLVNDNLMGAQLTPFNAGTSQGGAVSVNADGSFVYNPPPGFTGTDAFAYTVANPAGQSRSTVTITLSQLAFYVNNTAPAGGNGTLASPFNTLAQAVAAADPGDVLFVFRGDGTPSGLTGAVALQDGQSLIGEGIGFNFNNGVNPRDDILGHQIVAPGQPPVLTGPVLLADNNLVGGLILEGSGGSAILGDGIQNATIDRNELLDYSLTGIDLTNATGTLNLTDNVIRASDGPDGVVLSNDGVNAIVNLVGNTFADGDTADPGRAIALRGLNGSQLTATVSDNELTSPDFAAGWDTGIEMDLQATSTLAVRGNQLGDVQGRGISIVVAAAAAVGGAVENNQLENTGQEAIFLEFSQDSATAAFSLSGNAAAGSPGISLRARDQSTARLTVNANTVTDPPGPGLVLGTTQTANLVAVLSNNTVSGGLGGISGTTDDTSSLQVALRTNLLGGQTNEDALFSSLADSAMCLDITGNTMDELVLQQSPPSTMNVERLDAATGGPLETVNTVAAGGVVIGGAPSPQPAGFCQL
ncbi:MAG: right-handed parallel beta-helix repeat-containing protein [Armatimonadetes bacterium]|nr:right-handed parallel beta-helix repeat-containing protein [Armatimonadota bacterium]